MELEDLGLSVMSYNCLKRAGIDTLEDIIQKTEEDMIKIRNLGKKNLEEIKWKLKESGFALRDELELVSSNENQTYSKVISQKSSIMTLQGIDNKEILRFEPNGNIFIHGKLVTNDREITDGFREFLGQQGF